MVPMVNITANIGMGKSYYMCDVANTFFENNKKGKVIANFHLFYDKDLNPYFREKDFIYSPIGMIDLTWLENLGVPILIMLDDSEAIPNLDAYYDVVVRLSRKLDIDVYLVGHYYTDVSRKKRHISVYRVELFGLDENKNLNGIIVDNNDINYEFTISNEFERITQLYDTKEIVQIATPSLIDSEIKLHSKTLVDLEKNLKFFFKSEAKYEKKLLLYKKQLNFFNK